MDDNQKDSVPAGSTPPKFTNGEYLLPHINPEGVRIGLIGLGVCAAAYLLVLSLACCCKFFAWLTGPLFVVLALLAYGIFLFFRDPDRYPPADESAILSPADGKVCLVQECELPEELETGDTAKYWRVSVFMSVLDVHVNRMPTAAKILKKAYVPGKFINASLDKASKDNERCCYLMETPSGVRYAVVQIAGLVARRIVPFVTDGDTLQRAQRFGLIRFGSRLDVYLPKGVLPKVRVGQTMVAGETIIG